MTTTHTATPRVDGRETALPTARRRRKRRDWGRGVARALCVVLAVLGLLPFATTLAVRSTWVRTWAARETEQLLRAQGIVARYDVALRVWPLAVELTDVRVEGRDEGAPVLECARTRIRPKLFALFAGKLAIDQVEIDEPRVHLVVKDGKLTNLALPQTPASKGPSHAPFNAFALTDASLDLTIDDTHVDASALDLDVTVEDDPTAGSTYELAMRVGRAGVHRPRVLSNGNVASDDDALCSVDGRVRVEPEAILVRRLEGVGSADLDVAPGTMPPCDLPADDKRRVELSLGHLHIKLPSGSAKLPYFDGHVRVRAPLAIAERAASLPETDGWAGVDVDVRYGEDTILPDLSGSIEAHDVRLAQFSFAQELHSQLTVRRNIVESPVTTLRLGNGNVTLTDTVVDPLSKGARVEKTRLDATNVDFTELLRDLGVHPHPYVGWDIREVHTQVISGTLAPLKLDGDFTAKTTNFGVYDRPAAEKARERIYGLGDAQIVAHLGIRPDSLNFMDVRVTLPRSHVEGALVSIGFHGFLRVDAPHVTADLEDMSPIGPVALHGKLQTSGRVTGTIHHPEPEGDLQSLTGFGVADIQFGDLTSGHVKVDVSGPEVEITGVRAKRRDSPYEVPSATLKFGGTHGFVADAVGSSSSFGLRDLLSMFALDEDPRYDGLDARIATRADVHVALGGPEDKCGSGYIAVDAKGHLTGVGLFGEHFAQGDADMSMRWYDRDAGITGADIDVRSFVLSKVQPASGTRPVAIGTVLGSATIHRGGAVSGNVMIEGVSLSRVDSLASLTGQLEGSASGMAHVSGNLDDFRPDASLVTRAEIDVSGTRLREVPLASSHLQVEMTQRFPQQKRAVGHSRCGAPTAPPFDRAAYVADVSSHGEWKVNGELLGGTVRLTDVVATRAKAPRMSGRVSLRGVDLGPLARVYAEHKADSDESLAGPAPASAIGGQLWGELVADDVPLDDPARARLSFLLGPTVITRGAQKIAVRPPPQPITIHDDTLTVPPIEVTLDASEGFTGGFVLTGEVTKLIRDPTLALEARLDPIDLAVLQHLVPKVERARGRVVGSVRVTGKAKAPVVAGELHAAGEELVVHGFPSALTDMRLDVRASATELTASGSAKFAGGTVSLVSSVPVRGFEVGTLDSQIVVRGVRVAPSDGISATFDADLEVAYDGKAQGREGSALPRVTGDVTIGSFGYTRPISLTTDLGALGTRAKRTEVDTYDPSLDLMTFDVHVRAKSPLVIKNNLAEVQLGIDSGTLEVTGTNQRIGLRGALKAVPGGRFHFQSNEFEVRQGLIRFDDPTRVAPNVDVTAVTEYRRYTDTSAGAAAGAGAGGTTGASLGSTRGGSVWRITLHAFGDAENLRVDMTSEPSLSQEDIVLLLAVGMTRAELDQLQASSIGASIALNYLGAASGADRAVKQALPIIDDFRFGSAYSTVTGKTEPQLTVGKRLTNDLRASVTAGLSEDRELRSNIEWRLNNRLSVQGSYDNINDVSSSAVGNLGVDLRWRLEFE